MEANESAQIYQIFIPTIVCPMENGRVALMPSKPQISLSLDMNVWGGGVTCSVLNQLLCLGECMV